MAVIPQRELRNRSGEILRRAEAGERFTVTVGGRPVAELGPLERPRAELSFARLNEIVAGTPVDDEWFGELMRMRAEDRANAVDPWR